ncbi:MAG: elongation factor G [Tistlia sp.]|uniref:elongation factor G n=1 Tax=Tistlia sp. TaxID=3057121 RepID=UPI0034A0E579
MASGNGGTGAARCAVLVGPYTAGKTSLLEALLHHAGATQRKGRVTDGNSVGDASPEARARQMTVELNVASCEYLGDRWTFLDCPGSVELGQEAMNALMAADVAVVVAEPEPDKAVALTPILKFLDDWQIPHLVFVNKMDRANARVRELLAAFQAVSSRPLVLRQVPIREGEALTGFVDLVSERAWHYEPNRPSSMIEMPEQVRERESEARRELLEALADFDDGLLEQLLEDKEPATEEVYAQLAKDLRDDLIVPLLFGSAEQDHGIRRLFKALRHETPPVEATAERLGIPADESLAATVVKTFHLPHTGRISLLRIWRGGLKEGATIGGTRPSGLFRLQGGGSEKASEAGPGDLIGLGRMEELKTGDLVTSAGRQEERGLPWPEPLSPVYAVALEPAKREDEVKLTASIGKLIEEDASLSMEHDADANELRLWGQGEIHLQIAAERLKSKYNVEVATRAPTPAYRETIRKASEHHARHKRQTGGHGQFADVKVRIAPTGRGEGFRFHNKVVGGAVPKQFIPAVEHGVLDYARRGPLGFPVVDFEVTLFDGQFHAVDSSEMAFRTVGRMAMSEALPDCEPVLLEPICEVTVFVPSEFTNRVHGLLSGRRGQILGFDARKGWPGWDAVKAHLPQAELLDLIVELRSLTQGVGSFRWHHDHLQELHGKLADQVVEQHRAEAAQ